MKLSKVELVNNTQTARIECTTGGGKIFVEVENEYADFLVHEVADPFVIAAMLPSLMAGEDIECETISDDLYYHSPTILYLLSKVFNKPCIKVVPKSIIHTDFHPVAVGTGFSGGIDSFATFINHTSEDCPKAYKITHLTLFNIGSYGNDYEQTQEKFKKDIQRARPFAEKVGLPLVTVNSNIGVLFTHKEIHHYSLRSTMCLSVAILSLSKLFKTYLISSSGTIDDMRLNRYDQYFYENSLTQRLSSHSTNILVAEANLNRVEKTKIVANSDLARDYLYVCAADIYNEKFNSGYKKDTAPNCSRCIKCVRTMMTLDLLGYRDKFSKRFDFAKYDKEFKNHIQDIATKKGYDHFSREVYELMQEKGVKIPCTILMRGWLKGKIKQIRYKIKNI